MTETSTLEDPVSTAVTVGPAGAVADDPLAPRQGSTARFARRLGWTEGQLYSLAFGALLLGVVSVNALPKVQWDGDGQTASAAFPAKQAPFSEPAPASPEASPVAVPEPGAPVPDFDVGDSQPLPDPLMEPASPSEPFSDTPPAETPAPLAVEGGGFTSAAAGTPLATLGVPEDSVAVAIQGGQLDKVTYLKLSGQGSLTLSVNTAGANRLEALAALQLCPAAADASVGRGDVTPQAAPPYDCSKPVKGVRDDAGTQYVFDLAGLSAEKLASVAILPVPSSSPDFQVVFTLPD